MFDRQPAAGELGERFHALHQGPTLLLLPNAWDVLSARVFEEAGFPAVATTSGGIAWSLGYADGETMPRDEALAAIRRIARSVAVPVTADIEGGYAGDPAGVGETVARGIDCGAVGFNIEDSTDHHRVLRTIPEAARRIGAARAAADRAGLPVFLNARVDVFLAPAADPAARMAEAIARARAYCAAGADGVYPIGLSDPAAIGEFAAAVAAPVNVWARPGGPGLAALARAGVRRVSTATAPALVAAEAVTVLARRLRAEDDFAALAAGLAHGSLQRLIGRRA